MFCVLHIFSGKSPESDWPTLVFLTRNSSQSRSYRNSNMGRLPHHSHDSLSLLASKSLVLLTKHLISGASDPPFNRSLTRLDYPNKVR
jgi:hypothetical protein